MNPSKKRLDAELARLENESGMEEYGIRGRLSALCEDDSDCEPCKEWEYEVIAFTFHEDCRDVPNEWGKYFGLTFGDSINNDPDMRSIDENTIAYWNDRVSAAKNPCMKARYAGLIWNFSKKVSGEQADYQIARTFVNALLEIASGKYYRYAVEVIPKLECALSVAISLNDSKLQEQVKSAILEYENFIAVDDEPGTWGFSFDLLVGKNKKTSLDEDRKREVIRELEERMERLQKSGNHWGCEMAAERLIYYYGSIGEKANRIRVLRTLGSAFEEAARTVNPLLASAWLEHIHSLYFQYGLKNETEEMERGIHELGPEKQNNMQSVSFELEFDNRQLEDDVERMVQGSLEEGLSRIAMGYVENCEKVEKQVQDLAGRYPLSFMFPTKRIDHEGWTEALVRPLGNDLEGNVVKQMTDNILAKNFILAKVIDRAIEKYSLQADSSHEHVFQAPIFSEKKRELLCIGIQSYLSGSYAVAIHLIIPQIEAALRELIETSGGSIMKGVRGGGFDKKNINELLKTQQAAGILGNVVVTYLRVVLTDRRGLNIRNKVFHGIWSYGNFSRIMADRVLHILLLLAQLRKGDE